MQHVGTHLPGYTVSHFTKQLLLMLESPRIVILYRNYRESSTTHCGQ